MNGPLDEKASADATAMTSPAVLTRRAGATCDAGGGCRHVIRLS